MMHRCSSNPHGPCSCGLYHHHHHHTHSTHTQTNCNSFSMLFSMPNHKPYEYDHHHHEADMYVSPSVDCTLSLGTPSTRLITTNDNEKRVHHERRMSNFCWDILKSSSKHTPPSSGGGSTHKIHRGNNSNTTNSGGDPLSARRCANCDTTSTPLWRNGPRGPKSLCNACGIRFKKEERRATAAAATNGGGAPPVMDTQHMINSTTSWVPCLSSAYGNEFRFLEDDNRDAADTGMPFLSWRFNVTDRPSLVHDFTR